MRYLIGLPLCLVLVSGFLWWTGQGSNHLGAGESDSAREPLPAPTKLADAMQSSSAAAEPGAPAFDPILVSPCTLAPIQEQNVSSPIDGVLTDVIVSLGARVSRGQHLAQLDDQKLKIQIELLQIKATSESTEKIAKAQYDEADAKVKYAEKANGNGVTSVPELEVKTYLAERERYFNEIQKAREDRAEAAKELEKARVHWKLHQIQSALDGNVVKVFKKPGETVKQGDVLFRLARLDRLSIEGFCKVQHAPHLRPGQRVIVEAELQGPQALGLVGHTAAVNGLAIAQDGRLLASAGEDGTVLLWSWPDGIRQATLNHPAAVHAVDVRRVGDGPDGKYVIVTGCEDRLVRVWTFTPDGGVQGAPRELTGHEGAVRAVCLSADGQSLASGGEDRRVGWWKLTDKKAAPIWAHVVGAWKQTAHQGAVTGVQVADEGTIVSAGTDNVQKVWRLKGAEATLVKTHRGRSGDVPRLGLGHDGTRLLQDHGDELRVVERDGGSVLGALHNPKHVRFEEFARLSPSQRLILTASADGRLQIWQTPVEPKERAALAQAMRQPGAALPNLGGFEVRQYQLPKASQARCGVFAPDESVFFTAGTDRVIRVWTVPPPAERAPREAVLTYVGSELEPGTDLVHIQAEMDNPLAGAQLWRPGTFVHLKIFPTSPER